MTITSLNMNPVISKDPNREKLREERINRLKQVSNDSIQETMNLMGLVDSGYITEEDMFNFDPDMSGMVKYSTDNTVMGSNVPQDTNTQQIPNQMTQPQYVYNANVDTTAYRQQQQMYQQYPQQQMMYQQQQYYPQQQQMYQQYPQQQYYPQQQQMYQQPRQQTFTQFPINKNIPIYDGNGQLYSQMTPQQQAPTVTPRGYYSSEQKSNHMLNTNGYTPQNIDFGTTQVQQPIMYQRPTQSMYQQQPYYPQQQQMYYNSYGVNRMDFCSDEEYKEEIERLENDKKKKCEGNVALAMFFRGLSEVAGSEFSDTTEEYRAKMEDQYGYKTEEQIRQKRIDENAKRIEEQRKYRSTGGLYTYDENGRREQRFYIRAGITDSNGVYRETTPPVDPNTGYRTVIYTREQDEALIYENQHFWDPYIKQMNWMANFNKVTSDRIERFSKKYDQYSWQDLVGPNAKMADYYDEMIVNQDGNALKVLFTKGQWQNSDGNYNSNFLHSGLVPKVSVDNRSDCFSEYGLAKKIHAANLSITPDEMQLNTILNNGLSRDYDYKRHVFVDKFMTGNTKCDMSIGAGQVEVVPTEDIMAMTEAEAVKYINEEISRYSNDDIVIGGTHIPRITDEEREYALSRTDNIDEEGNHIVSEVEIENPGCLVINGIEIPIEKRTITRGISPASYEGGCAYNG